MSYDDESKPNLFVVPGLNLANEKPNGLKELDKSEEKHDEIISSCYNLTQPKFEIFTFKETIQIRSILKDGEPWFILLDICKALEITNTSTVAERLDDDEKNDLVTNDVSGKSNRVLIINESGLYSLILTSRKPEAKVFKKWITSEVLPSIRKTGSYSLTSTLQTDTQLILQTFNTCIDTFNKFQKTTDQKLNYLYKVHEAAEIRSQENFKLLIGLISKQIDNAAVINYKEAVAYNTITDPTLTHATVKQFLINNKLKLNMINTYPIKVSNIVCEITLRSNGIIHKIGGVKAYPIEILTKYFKENPTLTI